MEALKKSLTSTRKSTEDGQDSTKRHRQQGGVGECGELSV